MELKAWLGAVTEQLGTADVALDDDAVGTLLDLARDAAHEVERVAAPLTTYLAGVAVGRGASLDEVAATVLALLDPPTPAAESSEAPRAEGGRVTWRVRRLWVRWTLLILFVAILGTAFVNLGEWQLDRLHQRQQRNVATVANERNPVRPYTDVFTRPIVDDDQWQRVEARGTFDAEHQYLLRYRNNGGADGYEVVTPLQTASGAVLVDRGFVRLEQGQAIPAAAPAPPSGEVTVVGHVRRNERGRSSATRPVNGQMRLISSDAIGPTLPYPVVNGYIGLLSVDPPQTGGFVPVELPEISDGPHFWYAVQWFMFAGIGLTGVVVFIRGDLRARREEQAEGDVAVPDRERVSAAP